MKPVLNSSIKDGLPSVFEELKPPLSRLQAFTQASKCLECGGPYAEAPCISGCPTGIDVPGFIKAIYENKLREAADIILAENVLGASCSRVCPTEILCEGACVLKEEGRRPIEIGRLQRYAMENYSSGALLRERKSEATGKKVAVIGAGPAGLSCAAELALKGHEVTVFDRNEDFGGLIRYAIAPYRLNKEPLPKEAKMIEDLGVTFKMGADINSSEKLKKIEDEFDGIFLGIGLGKDVELSYEGENLSGVWDSLDFIHAIKTGKNPDIGNSVAVIGGGNTAIDVAREAIRIGAREVTLYYRRTEAEMPAYDHEIEEAREEGVRFQFLINPIRFIGNDRLEFMECRYMKLGEPDSSGRPRPVNVPGTEFKTPVSTVIKAIGQQKRKGFLNWIKGIELYNGLIKIDPKTGQTANPKYFAGGDALNGGATAVEAVQDGKIAARGIDRYLKG
ncbi:MAG TPA: NAD(P)-dependent oxidoreductase [Balneolaceae bacterium]|nr:NAD(P)-dependent oxidoreductase [Balneolaceae bacterium]